MRHSYYFLKHVVSDVWLLPESYYLSFVTKLYSIPFCFVFRGELEQQRRARLNEVQTPQQIR